jgi:hypothetical protein
MTHPLWRQITTDPARVRGAAQLGRSPAVPLLATIAGSGRHASRHLAPMTDIAGSCRRCSHAAAMSGDGHGNARADVERGQKRAAGTASVVERDAASAVPGAPDVVYPV